MTPATGTAGLVFAEGNGELGDRCPIGVGRSRRLVFFKRFLASLGDLLPPADDRVEEKLLDKLGGYSWTVSTVTLTFFEELAADLCSSEEDKVGLFNERLSCESSALESNDESERR